MTAREKTLQRWKKATEEKYKTVESTLFYFGFRQVSSGIGSSHRIFEHEQLRKAYENNPSELDHFGPMGQLTIPVTGGQKVKGRYLRYILEALEIIHENNHEEE